MFLYKKNSIDEHEEVGGECYERWFEHSLLANLPEGSIIVVDNASCYSRKLESLPTTSWRNENIKKIIFEDVRLKRDL